MLADKLRSASLAALPLPLPEFVSASTSNITDSTVTVTAPTGIQDGDLLVALVQSDSNSSIYSCTPPAGFGLSTQGVFGGVNVFVGTKIASGESGNYTFTFSDSTAQLVTILVYRNANRCNTLGSIYSNSTNGTRGVTAASIVPTYRGALIAAFAHFGSSKTLSSGPSGMTQRVASTTSKFLYVYDLNPQEASSTGDKTLTWGGTNTNNATAFLLQITNEPLVAPEFVASASTQNASSGTTLTINKPTGTVDGDLMVAVMSRASGNTDWTSDTGWTEVADQSSNPDLSVAYKVAGPSEPSTYTFTSLTASTFSGSILTYRYAAYDTIGSFTTGTNPLILPSISPSESQSILIAAGARAAASVTLGTPTSMTARVTDNDATSPSYIVCDQTVAKGPTGTRSMSTGSLSEVAGIMLALKPTRNL